MLMSFFRSWTKRGERKTQPIRTRATSPTKKPRTRPTLEALEDRLVPTIVFTPQFGAENYTGTNNGMQDPPVHLIFSGQYWTNTTQGQQQEQTIIASAKNIINGPYLSGLKQYGGDGMATYAGFANTSTTISGIPSDSTLQGVIGSTIKANSSLQPGKMDLQHAPIYIVFADPNSSGAKENTGFNQKGTYNGDNIHMIYVGTGLFPNESDSQWKDMVTKTISHELAETISDPASVGNFTPGANLPSSVGITGAQVSDYEPEGSHSYDSYGYRLNGDYVQAYWSQNDRAFIIPDGHTQDLTLQPLWNGGSFTGQYNLFVNGDQGGTNTNDQITVGESTSGPQTGGVAVTLNGQTFTFDQTILSGSAVTLPNIYVNTGGGTNQVNVTAVSPGVSVNVNSYSFASGATPSNDAVTIGSNGSLASINGPVNVSNDSGQTKLVLADTNSTFGRIVNVTANTVTFSSEGAVPGGQVNYSGASTAANGSIVGVTSLEIDGGHGGDTFNVYGTAWDTPVTLDTAPPGGTNVNTVNIKGSSSAVTVESVGNDNVVVGNAGSLAGIGGPVNVSNISGQDKLTLDDSNDNSARSIDISSNAVTFAATASEPAVTINYSPAVTLNSGQVIGVNQLTIWDAAGANKIEVDSVGAKTPTTIEGDYLDTLTGAAAGQVQFKPYRWYRTGLNA
jgi:hypothetical protein